MRHVYHITQFLRESCWTKIRPPDCLALWPATTNFYLTLEWQMKVGEEKLWRKIGATTLNCAQGKNASQSLRFIMMGRKKRQTCYLLGEQGAALPAIVDTVQFDQIH